jgi:hypothetical protein
VDAHFVADSHERLGLIEIARASADKRAAVANDGLGIGRAREMKAEVRHVLHARYAMELGRAGMNRDVAGAAVVDRDRAGGLAFERNPARGRVGRVAAFG